MLPELNDLQLKQLAEFVSNMGIVFFGTAVTPILIIQQDINIFAIVSGVALTLFCVTMSLTVLKGAKND